MEEMLENSIVSIITPMHNCSQFIRETVNSVQNQTFKNWEMIIVNDCSTDNSLSIVEEIAREDNRIKIINLQENSGAAIARNVAIENAKGKYIAFLDSDDIWLPEKLEIQIQFMIDNDIGFSYTAYMKIDEDGNEGGVISIPEKVTYQQLLKGNVIGCLTAIYDTEKIGKVFMPNIRKRQDHALWLKILRDYTDGYGLDKCLARYRVRQDSISSNKMKAAAYQWRLYRQIENLSFIKSAYYFMNYAYNGFRKSKI